MKFIIIFIILIPSFAFAGSMKNIGEKGKHSRFAVGVSSLPRNVPVEVEGIFEIKI